MDGPGEASSTGAAEALEASPAASAAVAEADSVGDSAVLEAAASAAAALPDASDTTKITSPC